MDRATAWKTRAVHPAQLSRQRQRVYHTVWTPQTAPTRSTGTLFTLEHHATGRISSTRCDTDGRELTDERRCAQTSVHVRRNLRSRSSESAFTFTEIATCTFAPSSVCSFMAALRGKPARYALACLRPHSRARSVTACRSCTSLRRTQKRARMIPSARSTRGNYLPSFYFISTTRVASGKALTPAPRRLPDRPTP